MEADWEFEIAPDAPLIDATWFGYVDLRTHPEIASRLPEAQMLPALASTLITLNAANSPVWTAKCDVWEPEAFDADELDAPPQSAAQALSCYIDLLPSAACWCTPAEVADWCRELCTALRAQPLRHCRVDLVIRTAVSSPRDTGLGVTAYVTGCGVTRADAKEALSPALTVLANAITRSHS